MWFRFPKGCERISIERQEFATEIHDENGFGYFRAPDHFSARILEINGFSLAGKLPEGAPADLPKSDPLRDNAITALTNTIEALKIETQSLRTDLAASAAKIRNLENEKQGLETALTAVNAKLASIEYDEEEIIPQLKALPGGKAK
jgi:hypothetical protein